MKNSGMYIVLHGYDHYWLGKMNEEEMKQDIDKAINIMDEFIEKDRWVFNYPYGSYNDEVIKYLEQKGCKLALTTETRVAKTDNDKKYLLPRLDCIDFPPRSNNYLNFIKE